jgi:hypothetical protein
VLAIEPENRDLLQLASEGNRVPLFHDHGDTALAVLPIGRTGIHIDESIAESLQAPPEIALSLLIFLPRQILSPWIERRQHRERTSEPRRSQPRQILFRWTLAQIDFQRGRQREA